MKMTTAVKGEENHNHCVPGEREPCLGNLGIAQRSLWILGDHLHTLSGGFAFQFNSSLSDVKVVYKFIFWGVTCIRYHLNSG